MSKGRWFLLSAAILALGGETVYFVTRALAGLHHLLGEHALLRNDHLEAWSRYHLSLKLGGDRDRIETDLVELLLFGLDQHRVGVRIDLPLHPAAAVLRAQEMVAKRIRDHPHRADLWSLAADVLSQTTAQRIEEKGFDLSQLSEDPRENVPHEEWLALGALKRATLLEPATHLYHDFLVEALLRHGLIRSAAQSVGQAMVARPVYREHPYLTGAAVPDELIEAAVGGLERAASVLSLVPRAEILTEAGSLLAAHRRDADAIAYFERAIGIAPDLYDAQAQISISLFRLGEHVRSLRHAEEAIQLAPDRPWPYLYAGLAYRAIGDLTNSIATLRRARELAPGRVRMLHALAEVLEEAGRREEAQRQYRAAVSHNPEDVSSWSALLAFHLRGGDWTSAREVCARILAMRPEDRRYRAQCSSIGEEYP